MGKMTGLPIKLLPGGLWRELFPMFRVDLIAHFTRELA